MPRSPEAIQAEIVELRAKRARVTTDFSQLVRDTADRDQLTPGEQERYNNLDAGVAKIDGRIIELEAELVERQSRLDDLRRAASDPTTLTEPGEDRGPDSPDTALRLNRSFNVGRGRTQVTRATFEIDQYARSLEGVAERRNAVELRGRAEAVVESWRGATAEQRETALRHVEHAGEAVPGRRDQAAEIAEHLVRLSNPEYVDAFRTYLASPANIEAQLTMQRHASFISRAAMNEGTTSQGGFMVPPMLDPTIVLTNTGTENAFRQISTVKSITTQTWKGVSSAGVTAEWTAEAAEMADASPTVAQPTITPVRADAYVQVSWEILADTEISQELLMLFGDARDRLEGAAFATGSGSTQPLGLVTRLNLVTASRLDAQTNGSYGAVDVYAMDNALPPRWRRNASWMGNRSIWNLTRQFATGSGPQHAFWTDFGGGRPASLIGYPVYESSDMFNAPLSTATASNDLIAVLGDFSQYLIVDRVGMSIVNVPVVLGANRRPSGEAGFAAWWRVGSGLRADEAFRGLRV